MQLVPNDSPNRCQKSSGTGQCNFEALSGNPYCEKHNHKATLQASRQRDYDIRDAQVAGRVDHFAGSNAIYSLHVEIAALRMALERHLDRINDDPTSIMLVTPTIVTITQALEKLVKTSGTMEVKFGSMLSKDTVLALAKTMMSILNEELLTIPEGAEIIQRVGDRIANAVQSARDTEKE